MTGARAPATAAVVVGGGINALGVVRSLARARVPVIVVSSQADAPAMRSRYARKLLCRDPAPDALVPLLETLAGEDPDERRVLILTQEDTVKTVVEQHPRLAACYRLTLGAPGPVKSLLHKDAVRAAAETAGLCVPRTCRVERIEQAALAADFTLPVVVKPARRDAGYERRFKKAYKITTRDDLYALLAEILPVLPDLIVQEWIEGRDSDLFFCLQYLAPDSGRVASFTGRKIRSWPPLVGGTASCAPAPEAAELAATTTRFFRHAGISGLASMEYKRDARSGAYVVVEPTVGRTDFQEELATLNGVNLPLAAYRDALGLAFDPARPDASRRARPCVWRERSADSQAADALPSPDGRAPANARTVDALWRITDPMPGLASLSDRVVRRLNAFKPRRLVDDK